MRVSEARRGQTYAGKLVIDSKWRKVGGALKSRRGILPRCPSITVSFTAGSPIASTFKFYGPSIENRDHNIQRIR
jgi:hypothetical protein